MTGDQNAHYNVLFLCTGNSARSILAEASLRRWGKERFTAYSAGSHPKGRVHPAARALIKSLGWPTEGLRSKSWNEFAREGAPVMDFVITVCDTAAGEACPIWLGHPVAAHWGVPDPAAVKGSAEEVRRAFEEAYLTLDVRVRIFTSLRPELLDGMSLKRRLDDIGRLTRE